MQLLEMMQMLHTRAGRIFRSWGEEHPEESIDISALWDAGWCPLLQGIARLCCDVRRSVRTHAFNCLSSSLLVQDLQGTGQSTRLMLSKRVFPLFYQI